jgi:phage major head subunit gpT-like protein
MIINAQNLAMLRQGYNAAFKKGFHGFGVEGDWTQVASQQPSGTREGVYSWLGQFPKLREWIGDRQIKNLRQHDYSILNRRFETTIEVPVDDIEDDQYGVYNMAFENAGAAVKVWPDDLVFGEAAVNGATGLCYDGQPFLDANHPMAATTASNYDSSAGTVSTLWYLLDTTKPLLPFIFQLRKPPKVTSRMMDTDPNVFDEDAYKFGVKARGNAGYGFWQLAYGSINDLTSANFDTYVETMMNLTSDEGYKLGVKPNLLVCGASRRAEALDLLERQLISSGESNRNYRAVDLLITPHLT